MLTPFTLDEATEICEDFEDLVDTEFTISGSSVLYLVDGVVMAPFPEADKQTFIDEYVASFDWEQAMSKYSGDEYDVLVFASDADNEADLVHLGIRAFAAEQGIAYGFPQGDEA